ncbi:MAG: hypothetical protein ACI9Y1_000379 [Lentisphaeria bacterium]|jgi:hypothetical protein
MKHSKLLCYAISILLYGCGGVSPGKSSAADPSDSQSNTPAIPAQEERLKQKYASLEKRYKSAHSQGIDLSRLEPKISEIKSAKRQKNYPYMSRLLDELSALLDKKLAETTFAPDIFSPTPGAAFQTAREVKILSALSGRHYFQALHSVKGSMSIIDDVGAVGRNRKRFSDVAAQRDALWLIRRGLINEDHQAVDKGVQAFAYAFSHQTPDGNFKNAKGVDAKTAVGVDAFFLYSYTYAYLLLKDSEQFRQQFLALSRHLGKMKKAVFWLKLNTKELYRQDRHTPNRLLFDAMAFFFAGKISSVEEFSDAGRYFIAEALKAQRDDGVFLEKGGYDTSYQAVNILNLCHLIFYVEQPELRATLQQSLRKAVLWLDTKIDGGGIVSAAGNTRTGLGQEMQSGKKKDINYPEVALSLYYSAYILSLPSLAEKADRVVAHALKVYGLE